jgi:hypothetical protein
MVPLALILALLVAQDAARSGWAGRLPVIVTQAPQVLSREAAVVEVHAAVEGGDLRLRLTLDRPVKDVLYLPDGTPVSGRLRAAVLIDTDGDRSTGLDEGERDLRTGAERRLDVETISVQADPDEKRPGQGVVAATLRALERDGRRRVLWRGDDTGVGGVTTADRFVEIRLPAAHVGLGARARLVLDSRGRTWAGQLNR